MVFLAAITSLAALSIFAGGPARAAQQQICGNGGTGYCMNAWNGKSDGPVDMYYGGSSHEDFLAVEIDRCNGLPIVTDSCPFQNTSFDQMYLNDTIVQIEYVPYDQCISGDVTPPTVLLDTCNNPSTGSGGAYGTVYVIDKYGELISKVWTDNNLYPSGLKSGGNPGTPLYDDQSCVNQACTNWGL